MASAQAAIDIKRSPDDVWAVIGDFGGIGNWMPGIESCRVEGEDRILALTGMEITERLVSNSDTDHTQTYAIVDGVPVEYHQATITVLADGDGAKVTWDVEARPDEMAGVMQGMYQQSLETLKGSSRAEKAVVADWAFEARAASAAPVEAVWPLVGQASRWKDWSFLTHSGLEREGEPAPDGVGAIRRFTTLGIGSREEVVLWEPPHHLGYVILSGFPARNYRGDVVLTAAGAGTRLTWAFSFDTKIPGSGRLAYEVLRRIVGRFAAEVVRAAEASVLKTQVDT